MRWAYRDAAGALLGFVCRFEEPDDGKSFRPLTLWADGARTPEWRWESWPEPRPLYGLDQLAARPDAPVVLCEGEKVADAVAKLLPDHVAIASPGGSKAAAKADWALLKECDVTIWPDADEPGAAYAEEAAKQIFAAGACRIALVTVPENVSKGWDGADALAQGWSTARTLALISTAQPFRNEGGKDPEGRGDKEGRRPRGKEIALQAAEGIELWHSPEFVAYASIERDGHAEHWRLKSRTFERFLALRCYEISGTVPTAQAINDTLRVLEAKACRGLQHTAHLRVAADDTGACWLGLGDEA